MPFAGIPEEALSALQKPTPALVARLDAALTAAGASSDSRERVLEFGRLLLAANTLTNLTGARDWYDLIESHLEDCALALTHVPAGVNCLADWGSGGGMPGLVWAALRPDWTLHLCERNGKKAAFLEEAARRLQLKGVKVHARQLHEVLGRIKPVPQAVVARAVAPLPKMLQMYGNTRQPLLWMAGPSGESDFWSLGSEVRAQWRVDTLGKYELAQGRGSRSLMRLTPRGSAA